MPRARRSFSCVYGAQTIRITDQFHINFRLCGRRGWRGRGRTERGVHHQSVSRKRGTGHERATVFVNVTTKLSAVPRLTRHSLKFHREIAPQARRATARGRKVVEKCGEGATLSIARARGLITRGWLGDTKAIRGDYSLSFSTVARLNCRG